MAGLPTTASSGETNVMETKRRRLPYTGRLASAFKQGRPNRQTPIHDRSVTGKWTGKTEKSPLANRRSRLNVPSSSPRKR